MSGGSAAGSGVLRGREDPQDRTVVPEIQLLTVLLGFDQDADGFSRLPHQVQIHLFVVWHYIHTFLSSLL